MIKLKHLIESQQLDNELIFDLFKKTDDILAGGFKGDELKGKVMCTLFYEPSTRTRLSFESAMLRLGGHVISTENAKEFSSSVKGISIDDILRIVYVYAGCFIISKFGERTSAKSAEES